MMETFDGMWAAVVELSRSPLVIWLAVGLSVYGLLSWRFRWSGYGRSTRSGPPDTPRIGSDGPRPRLRLVTSPGDDEAVYGDSRPPYDWQESGL